VTLADAAYPAALRDLALPPPVLALRGRLPEGPAVAVVGSRRADGYGREAAAYFAGELAAAGVTVVSGFARGVDAVAHRATLAAGGTTVAVLGCGIDVDYPSGHAELGAGIAGRGGVVSEFACASPPRTWHFPVRNRLIAALGRLTLVIQAAPRSGSLSTAHHALELGRDVWAVPGRIFDELALGTNALVADGAYPARAASDLLAALGLDPPGGGPSRFRAPAVSTDAGAAPAAALPAPPPGLAGELLAALPEGVARTVDELAAALDLPVDRVLGALLELELGGWLRREPGPVYVR
jgi:DNA processing protein